MESVFVSADLNKTSKHARRFSAFHKCSNYAD